MSWQAFQTLSCGRHDSLFYDGGHDTGLALLVYCHTVLVILMQMLSLNSLGDCCCEASQACMLLPATQKDNVALLIAPATMVLLPEELVTLLGSNCVCSAECTSCTQFKH